MAYLYLELLKDSLNEYAYAAELAGLSYDLQNTIYGMYVSTHARPPTPSVYIDRMEAFGTVGMTSLKKKKKTLWFITFSFYLIFKLAFILTFHCVPFIVCRVSLIFFLTIFHQNAIFFSSNKIVPTQGLALTHSVSELLRFRKTE